MSEKGLSTKQPARDACNRQPDGINQTLDELSQAADQLVDNLIEEPAPGPPRRAHRVDGDSIDRTVDRLVDRLQDEPRTAADPDPPAATDVLSTAEPADPLKLAISELDDSIDARIDAMRIDDDGGDIGARLDDIFGPSESAGPVASAPETLPAEPPVVSEVAVETTSAVSRVEPPDADDIDEASIDEAFDAFAGEHLASPAAEVVGGPAAGESAEPDPPEIALEDIPFETEVDEPASLAATTEPAVEPLPTEESGIEEPRLPASRILDEAVEGDALPGQRSANRWLIAASIAFVAIAGGLWMLLSYVTPGEGELALVQNAADAKPAPMHSTQTTGIEPARTNDLVGDPGLSDGMAQYPALLGGNPTLDEGWPPPPPRQPDATEAASPSAEAAPEAPATTPATKPVPARKPAAKTPPPAAPVKAAPVEAAPVKAAPVEAGPVKAVSVKATVPVPKPSEPRFVPPEVLVRKDPETSKRSRKKGESGVVELSVLVDEHGKVVRVVVENGIPGSDLEARAIDAVLRSTYRPALEDGKPHRAWTTATYVFD